MTTKVEPGMIYWQFLYYDLHSRAEEPRYGTSLVRYAETPNSNTNKNNFGHPKSVMDRAYAQ